MANLERDDVESSLKKKGFSEEDSGKDHRFYRFCVDGKYSGIFTKTSRGKKYKTLGAGLVSAMAKQLHLSTGQFRELVECTMTYEQYVAHLQTREAL